MILRVAAVGFNAKQVIGGPGQPVHVHDRPTGRVLPHAVAMRVRQARDVSHGLFPTEQRFHERREGLLPLAADDVVHSPLGEGFFESVAEVNPARDDHNPRVNFLREPR